MTKKGSGKTWVFPPMVTWRSPIASNKALCTLAGERLISSAKTRFANTGPRCGLNVAVFGMYTMVPTTSLGNRSGVNWIRSNLSSSTLPNDLTKSVLATPGMPSRRTCPPTSNAICNRSMISVLPSTALPSSLRTRSDHSGPLPDIPVSPT